jgi:hypothetical protein
MATFNGIKVKVELWEGVDRYRAGLERRSQEVEAHVACGAKKQRTPAQPT